MDGARSRPVARTIVAGSVLVPVRPARLATQSRKVDTRHRVRRSGAGPILVRAYSTKQRELIFLPVMTVMNARHELFCEGLAQGLSQVDATRRPAMTAITATQPG